MISKQHVTSPAVELIRYHESLNAGDYELAFTYFTPEAQKTLFQGKLDVFKEQHEGACYSGLISIERIREETRSSYDYSCTRTAVNSTEEELDTDQDTVMAAIKATTKQITGIKGKVHLLKTPENVWRIHDMSINAKP